MIPTPANTSAAADGLYATAHWLYEAAKYTEATDVFRALLLVSPADERGWLGMGTCQVQLERRDVALKIFAMGAVAVPGSSRCCLAAAQVLLLDGHREAAEEALEKASEAAESAHDDEVLEAVAMMRRAR